MDKLPEWDGGIEGANALTEFIWNNEPDDEEEAGEWRAELLAAINWAIENEVKK